MSDLNDYVDVRELLPGYTTVPCCECGATIHVTNHFPRDDWYCLEHTPADVDMKHLRGRVTVRL